MLVGRVEEGGAIRYAAVTSCIQLVFQLDGGHVVTVEGLRDGSELNPIQQAMVSCQGTQCGFCTPGFVVSLYDLMQGGRPLDAEKPAAGSWGRRPDPLQQQSPRRHLVLVQCAGLLEEHAVAAHRVVGAGAGEDQTVVAAEGRDHDADRHDHRAEAGEDRFERRRRDAIGGACCSASNGSVTR